MQKATIAVIGGTGAEGGGLAKRWAAAGYPIIIGSREEDKAQAKAQALNDALTGREGVQPVRGMENIEAAAAGEIVVLTVPYRVHAITLMALQPVLDGKILVDCTVPLKPPNVARVQLPVPGSAGVEAQTLLGEAVRVVSAFQNVSAEHLNDSDHAVPCDVLVTGNAPEARATVIELAEAAGLVALHAGRIENAAAAEALTSLLIFINKHYRAQGAGIKITNLP